MRGDAKVQHLATAMFQHDEHEQDFQADRRHGEKVDRDHLTKMVVQERLPRLSVRTGHIGNRLFLRHR